MDEKKSEELGFGPPQTIWEPDPFQKDLEGFINRTQQQFLISKKSEDLNATRTPANVVTRITDVKRNGSLSLSQASKPPVTARASDIAPDTEQDIDNRVDDLYALMLRLLAQLQAFLLEAIRFGLDALKDALEEAIEALKESLEKAIELVEESVKALQESLNQLAELVYSLETDLTMLSQDVIALQKNVADLLKQITELVARVLALEERFATIEEVEVQYVKNNAPAVGKFLMNTSEY